MFSQAGLSPQQEPGESCFEGPHRARIQPVGELILISHQHFAEEGEEEAKAALARAEARVAAGVR